MAPRTHPPNDVSAVAATLDLGTTATGALVVEDVHAAHGDFVWATLQRLGVRDADLEDRFQEVFLVVHQRGGEFEGRSRVTTWLYGIARRVVAAHRRRAWVRRERPTDDPPDAVSPGTPEVSLAEREARARLREVLDAMDLDRRAVFVMSVIEELPADEVATILGVAVGTVYSRLHAARREFDEVARRLEARAQHRSLR